MANGTLACWGRDDSGQATPPAGTFTAVTAGYVHSCGLRTDGTIACWGSNVYGQAAPPAGTFTQLSAGGYVTCALEQRDASVACWGAHAVAQTPGVSSVLASSR
jgi:hypothetical protein